MGMFCYQCEQTANGSGCAAHGVCGKAPEVANLQDRLLEEIKRIAKNVPQSKEVSHFITESLFSTVTNVDFDPERFKGLLAKAMSIGKGSCDQATEALIKKRKEKFGDDVAGLQELLMYGIKGMAAYIHHARVLGKEDQSVYNFLRDCLSFLADGPEDINELLKYNIKCGEVNLRVMELLDSANTGVYGHPVPTKVRITPIRGKAILVSGHDLKDL